MLLVRRVILLRARPVFGANGLRGLHAPDGPAFGFSSDPRTVTQAFISALEPASGAPLESAPVPVPPENKRYAVILKVVYINSNIHNVVPSQMIRSCCF